MAAEAFKKHGVVPDVVKTAPAKVASVKFESGVEVRLLIAHVTFMACIDDLGKPGQHIDTYAGAEPAASDVGC